MHATGYMGVYEADGEGGHTYRRFSLVPRNGRIISSNARLKVLWEARDFRRYQSGQSTVVSGTHIITVPRYVYTWLILQFCRRS